MNSVRQVGTTQETVADTTFECCASLCGKLFYKADRAAELRQ